MKKKQIFFLRRLLLVLGIVVVGVFVYQKFFKTQEIRVVSKIDGYSYVLESNQTKIFKKYYKELKKELEDQHIDEENYARLVSQLFIIDFYTLSNKVTNQDVGGVQFLHSSIQDNFKMKATDTMYKYVKNNIYGNRRQQLPTVKDVKIEEIKEISYDYLDQKKVPAYQVKVNIQYKKNLGYDTSRTLILLHEEQKLVVAEIQ